jgi:hypothetical protein
MHFRPSQTCPCCGEGPRGAWSRRRFLAASGGSALGLSIASFACAEEIPTIAYESVPDLLRLPPEEVSGVALNSKGHIFVLHRGNTTGPAYGAAAAQLLEFDADGRTIGARSWRPAATSALLCGAGSSGDVHHPGQGRVAPDLARRSAECAPLTDRPEPD